jgi:hypothetical protein
MNDLVCDWCSTTFDAIRATDCSHMEHLCEDCHELHDAECEETLRHLATEES